MGERIYSRGEGRMQTLRDKAEELEPQRREWVIKLHPRVLKVVGHLHLPLYE